MINIGRADSPKHTGSLTEYKMLVKWLKDSKKKTKRAFNLLM